MEREKFAKLVEEALGRGANNYEKRV